MSPLENSKVAIPVISAIIERDVEGEKEILIQTRIADYDSQYYGSMEIPAGRIDAFENVSDSIKREVKEETGLDVIEIFPRISGKHFKTSKDDEAFVFQPFCCQQLLKGNIPWVGFVFVCKVTDAEPIPKENETKEIRWMKLHDLEDILRNEPDKIFTLQLPVLDFYLKSQSLK